ncbi:MAG: hypothetical protein NTY37_05325 [Methanothrix sp.]|nr:hypothetical protein [Methanothrix sp.]
MLEDFVWECGMMGQAFYLAGEAAGFQGCGIGCFFDDIVSLHIGKGSLRCKADRSARL